MVVFSNFAVPRYTVLAVTAFSINGYELTTVAANVSCPKIAALSFLQRLVD
jgi:hypothetical protein